MNVLLFPTACHKRCGNVDRHGAVIITHILSCRRSEGSGESNRSHITSRPV